MSVLRGYDLAECDRAGVPLDWERCRCSVDGADNAPEGYVEGDGEGRWWRATCTACGGHGSLRAAALAELTTPAFTIDTYGPTYEIDLVDGEMRQIAPARKADPPDLTVRCWECRHPMGDGTWEGDTESRTTAEDEAHALWCLRTAVEPDHAPLRRATHWSPCDDGCRHRGPVRQVGGRGAATYEVLPPGERNAFEASWRSVDVRTLGSPYDLRPEKLAVLCLRCYAERTP